MIKRLFNFLSFFFGVGFIFGGIALAVNNKGSQTIYQIIDPSSLAFIIFTLFGIALVSFGITRMIRLLWVTVSMSPHKANYQVEVLNKNLRKMADVYYRDGVSKIKSNIPFKRLLPVWRVLIEQLEINLPTRDIKDLLYNDADNFRLKISLDINMIQNISNIAPSIGVLGTVLGLIKVLSNMGDGGGLATIGPSMSLALMTTLYGIFIGTVCLKPIVSRLELIRDAYMNSYRQALFWIELIEQKKPTFYIEEKYDKKRKKK